MEFLTNRFRGAKEFFDKYESRISALFLVLGFTFDYFTLTRVDFFWDNFFIALYLVLAGGCILLLNLRDSEYLPWVMQFAFGGLFSAFVVFYSKSGSIFTSGIFLAVLAGLLLGNEFFKRRYTKLVFQVGIYFICLFSFATYFMPVLLRQMGAGVFLLAGAASLALIACFVFLLARTSRLRYDENKKYIFYTIFGLYALMNFFYFTNLIPPVPLALKFATQAVQVEREAGGNYRIVSEERSWLNELFRRETLRLGRGEEAYVFTAVFAPTRLQTEITHDWQYFDEGAGRWVSQSEISYAISGGRDEGYRGFTKKANIFPGQWRVDVKTSRGEVIGRVRFNIVIGDFERELKTRRI